MARSVAVIDIGSNTIKVLIATRTASGNLEALGMKTIEARISAGISGREPRLSEAGMRRGVDAVSELVRFATDYQPDHFALVATSAVRDARNGDEFRARVLAATGHPIRLLSGDDEANLIGRGLTADPALAPLRDFYLFDLGGGSMECLSFRDRHMQDARSFRLGCVRLTERFVPDVNAPVAPETAQAITRHVHGELAASGFAFDLANGEAVFAGGSMTTTRAILAATVGQTLETSSARVTIGDLRNILSRVSALPLPERKQVPGLPPSRADVYPAALITMIAVAENADVQAFQHSFYNLRWGVADEMLSVVAQ